MDLTFDLQLDGHKGAAVAFLGEKLLAEMTFSLAGEHLLIIDHTQVDDQLRGQGTGRKLLALILNWAEAKHKKILPLCPYARSVFDKEPGIQHQLHKA